MEYYKLTTHFLQVWSPSWPTPTREALWTSSSSAWKIVRWISVQKLFRSYTKFSLVRGNAGPEIPSIRKAHVQEYGTVSPWRYQFPSNKWSVGVQRIMWWEHVSPHVQSHCEEKSIQSDSCSMIAKGYHIHPPDISRYPRGWPKCANPLKFEGSHLVSHRAQSIAENKRSKYWECFVQFLLADAKPWLI